ncbi:MAG TPA: hypothetical protein VND24_06405 [Steroidobacteraceae bacterium]|nr:hypothetical protein [Steroidobacteraceae bacterium]
MRKAITVRLDAEDYERLQAEALRLGMPPGRLAAVYLRTSLTANNDEAERMRRAGLAALEGLAELRARLPVCDAVDVVRLICEEREEAGRRAVL